MSTTPVLHQQAIEPSQLTASRLDDIERIAHRLARVSWIPDVYKPVSPEMAKPWLPAKSIEQAEAEIAAAGMYLASIGRDLTPMTLKLVYVVNGAVDCMYDLISAQVHAHGHELWVEAESHQSATVAGKRHDSARVHRVTFTYEDAVRGGLTERWSKKDGKKVAVETYAKWTRDMLVARAGKRCAKRVAPEAMLTMPPAFNFVRTDSGRIQLAEIGHDVDDDQGDEDIADAELVEQGEDPGLRPEQAPGGADQRAHTGAASAPAHPGGGVSPSDPPAPSGHDEQDEVYANRRRRANAVMGEVGVKADDARHQLVHTATGGATESTGRLTAWQVEAVVDFCDRLKMSEGGGTGTHQPPASGATQHAPSGQSAPADRDNAAEQVVAAAVPGPLPGEWRARAAEQGVTDGQLLIMARDVAGALGVAPPTALKHVTDEVAAGVLEQLG
jgi:hypothetical protein